MNDSADNPIIKKPNSQNTVRGVLIGVELVLIPSIVEIELRKTPIGVTRKTAN